MCGLAGILSDGSVESPPFEVLGRMAASLRHRGPDGYGLYRDDRVGLAHTRLSIVDLAGGAQPIRNEDSTVWIVFNGEIFNHSRLRGELENAGHRFYTRTDTEVIVHAFEEWGEDAWRRFNGQFAFALWDARQRRLWLVRDRLGILPLHYARRGGRVVFGSEIKALFASDCVDAELDPVGLGQVFSLWAAPGPRTVFAGVSSVPPGTAISFDERLCETRSAYWAASFDCVPGSPTSLATAADELERRLSDAVQLRLRADVPVGAYLSGGLDSSVISQLALSARTSRLQTFSVRFEDPAFDETQEQRRMAAWLGTEHHEILCRSEDIRAALPDVVWHCETPLLRTAPVPMFLLSDLVRRSGMKVVLTGEGADELLAGYSIFKEDKVRRFWGRNPGSTMRPALLARVHPYVGDSAKPRNAMWSEFFRKGITEPDDPFHSHRVRWENTSWATRFLGRDIREQCTKSSNDGAVEGAMPPGWRGWRPLCRAQSLEIATFMSAYLLSAQGDRVAMGHGVEVRYPFLDPDVVDLCTALPDEMKLRGLRDKVALRRIASRHLPPEVWQRPKHPYRAPTATALFGGPGSDYVRDLLSDARLRESGLFDPVALRGLVGRAIGTEGRMSGEREEMALVGVLTLQLLADGFRAGLRKRIDALSEGLRRVEPEVREDRSSGAALRSPQSSTPRGGGTAAQASGRPIDLNDRAAERSRIRDRDQPPPRSDA